jgi:hypothetical protein
MKDVIVEDVIEMLEDGMSREEINVHYELNPRDKKDLWSNPALKGVKRSKYKPSIVIKRREVSEEVKEVTPPFAD